MQQYFSYIVSVRFIGWGNRSTRKKPLTCRKSDKHHIMLYQEYLAWVGFELTALVLTPTDYICSCNQTTIRCRPRLPFNGCTIRTSIVLYLRTNSSMGVYHMRFHSKQRQVYSNNGTVSFPVCQTAFSIEKGVIYKMTRHEWIVFHNQTWQ